MSFLGYGYGSAVIPLFLKNGEKDMKKRPFTRRGVLEEWKKNMNKPPFTRRGVYDYSIREIERRLPHERSFALRTPLLAEDFCSCCW